jgi:hypothetical protein
MKHTLAVLTVATALVTYAGCAPQSESPDEVPAPSSTEAELPEVAFNQGDLAGPDELSEAEDDGLDYESREYSYRATGPQIEVHKRKRVQIVVNKSMKERGYQYLQVKVDGSVVYDAPVSTAWEREAKAKTRTYKAYTPVGQFFPDGMQEKRFSNTWQVWLKHVIRFSGGIWLHATTPDHFMELGSPASGGCVRVYPSDAEQIYRIVTQYGMNNTAITVLPAEKTEKQVPWNKLNLQAPEKISTWRAEKSIR